MPTEANCETRSQIPSINNTVATMMLQMFTQAMEAKNTPDDKLEEIDTGGWEPTGGDSE